MVIQRVEYELEKLRHKADHECYLLRSELADKSHRIYANPDAVQFLGYAIEDLKNDVKLYDWLLAVLRALPK